MTSNDQERPAHRPFGADYPDPRGADDLRRERAEVRKQVERLMRFANDPRLAAEMFEKIRKRREGTESVGIAPASTVRGEAIFVDPNSFVRAPGRADRAGVLAFAALPADFPFTVDTTNSRTGVQLLRAAPPAAPEVGDGGVRSRRAQPPTVHPGVAVNHIVPLGGVVKAEGGPEPTTLRRAFPSVPVTTTGRPAVVAIIDTGVTDEVRPDTYLRGLADDDGENVDPLDAFPPPGDGLLDASAGHGTHVTGVVQQVAPSAQIRVYRAVDSDGGATDFQIGEAISRAGADGADIINLSLGSPTVDDQPQPAIRAAIEQVVADNPNILIVCAAGNNASPTTPEWPAALSTAIPNVVAVAGLDADGMPTEWSTRGPWVTCSTIGQGIASTYVTGTEDGPLIGDPEPDTFGADSWALWTGTSFAAPQIVGGVARRCHETGMTPREALDDLLDGAPETSGWGKRVVILPGT